MLLIFQKGVMYFVYPATILSIFSLKRAIFDTMKSWDTGAMALRSTTSKWKVPTGLSIQGTYSFNGVSYP